MSSKPRDIRSSSGDNPVAACPDNIELNRWLHEELTSTDSGRFEVHIANCHNCQAKLDDLTDVPHLTKTRILRLEGDHEKDPQLLRLRRRMAEWKFDEASRQRSFVQGRAATDNDPDPLNAVAAGKAAISKFPRIRGVQIQKEIGRGGFCTVFAAWDEGLQSQVAIKILNANRLTANHRQRFIREAFTIELLEDPNVVRVHRLDETEAGVPYLVMQLVNSGTLKDRIDKIHELSIDQINCSARLIIDVARGLSAVHQAGFLHRDIKPSNVLIETTEESEVSIKECCTIAKLADFGLVKFADNSSVTLTRATELIGTPAFMSPEQTHDASQLTRSSDIYSLGATLYFAITGQPPFTGSALAVIQQIQRGELISPGRLNPLVPKHLEGVCLMAMSIERSRRYRTAIDFANDLQRVLEGKRTVARPDNSWRRVARWSRRNRMISSLGILLLFSLIAGSIATTVLWKLSERNATEATHLATDLVASRERMRESVERFQSRVFADESLYLQMSSQLRKELFNDVIDYLDEFSNSAQAVPESNSIFSRDRIAENYLKVARAASTVQEYAEAKTASRRALTRIQYCLTIDKSDAAKLAQHSEAARLLFVASSHGATRDNLDRDLASKSIASAQRAASLQPDNKLHSLNEIQTRLCIEKTIRRENEYKEQPYSELAKLQNQLQICFDREQDTCLIQEKNLTLQMDVGLLLLDACDDDKFQDLFTKLERDLAVLRELYRSSLIRPMTSTHAMWGRLFVSEASYNWGNGKPDDALQSLQNAETFFEKAVLPSPNHRLWRLEFAFAQQQHAEFLAKLGRLNAAVEKNNQAIKNLIHLTESDIKDNEVRKLMIVFMIRNGEMQEQIGNSTRAFRGFYSAAQECNLLLFENHPDARWAWPVRIWALSKAIPHIQESDRGESRKVIDIQTNLFQQQAATHGFNLELALQMLTTKLKLVRPRILGDYIEVCHELLTKH